jgi:ppGpp synthetase/RelA/SpoT-type nucleotidyltranferase
MSTKLSNQDLDFILESLQDTNVKFENYDSYPSIEFKLQRVKEVKKIINKVQSILKEEKK